jgi:hypothetical protein
MMPEIRIGRPMSMLSRPTTGETEKAESNRTEITDNKKIPRAFPFLEEVSAKWANVKVCVI